MFLFQIELLINSTLLESVFFLRLNVSFHFDLIPRQFWSSVRSFQKILCPKFHWWFFHFFSLLLSLPSKSALSRVLYYSITFIYYAIRNDTFFHIFFSIHYSVPCLISSSSCLKTVYIISTNNHNSFKFDKVSINILKVVVQLSLLLLSYRWSPVIGFNMK